MQGGVNGRKINLISLDDGYSPPKTVEQVRRLVEDEKVAFLFQTLGTPSNTAIRPYCNDNKVPQLFVATGAAKWDDPKHFPWTIGYNPSYQTESRIYAKQILATKPNAKIGVLYQNDDFGKDYLIGLKEGLGADHAGMIVKEASYETSEPTVDSQVVTLQGSGADLFLIVATPKFAAQAIRKSYDLGWNAVRYITNVSVSIATILKPAGLDKSKGLITGGYVIDVTDQRYKDEPSLKAWKDVHLEIYVGDRLHRRQRGLRVRRGGDDDPGAQAMRQRPVARQRNETGGQPQEFRRAAVDSGHHDQHVARQLQPDPPIAAAHLQRNELGAVRGDPARLTTGSRARHHTRVSTASNTGSAETMERRRRRADAARKRSKGSRCGHSIVPAMRQSSASREAATPRWLKERWQPINVRRHFRPLAETHFLRDLEERNGADEDGLGLGHFFARGPKCVDRR